VTPSPPSMALNPWDPPPLYPVQYRHRRDIWAAAKQVDGLGGEWTYLNFIFRAANFHSIARPPEWAEPLGGFDQLYQEVWFNSWAVKAGITLENIGTTSASIIVFRSAFSASDNLWPMPEPDEAPIGRHSITIIGIVDEDTLLFRHDWSDWPKGYGRISREYIEEYASELWVVRPFGAGPIKSSIRSLVRAAGKPEYTSLWTLSRISGSKIVPGCDDLRVRFWQTFSAQRDLTGEIVAIELGPNIRVAIAMVLYSSNETYILDLFVWPPYRRSGYGSILEKFIASRGESKGSSYISSIVLEGDVIKGEEAAEGFLIRRGYELAYYEDSQTSISGHRKLH